MGNIVPTTATATHLDRRGCAVEVACAVATGPVTLPAVSLDVGEFDERRDMEYLNEARLCGVLTEPPRRVERPNGEVRWMLELNTVAQDGQAVPVMWPGELIACTTCVGTPSMWTTGTALEIVGAVQRRFFRAGGVTQSRIEVVARSIVEVSEQ